MMMELLERHTEYTEWYLNHSSLYLKLQLAIPCIWNSKGWDLSNIDYFLLSICLVTAIFY